MKTIFCGIPQTFSIMKKRVISIIACEGTHFVCYFAINFGAHFKDGNPAGTEPSFIANLDSLGGSTKLDPFVRWLFAVIYEIEVWVTQFLNTPTGVLIANHNLADIGRRCRKEVVSKTHPVCKIPIPFVKQAPTQSDGYNCGVFSMLNTRAGFMADQGHHVDWSLVRDPESLWTLVLKPFWQIPKDKSFGGSHVEERVTTFRWNLVSLLLNTSGGDTTLLAPLILPSAVAPTSVAVGPPKNDDEGGKIPDKDDPTSVAVGLPKNDDEGGKIPDKDDPPIASILEDDARSKVSALLETEVEPTVKPTDSVNASIPQMQVDTDSDSDASMSVDQNAGTMTFPDMTQDGKFFYELQRRAAQKQRQTQRRRKRFARWLDKSSGMTYDERQAYFVIKRANREARQLEADRPIREALEERKRKKREWKEKSEEIETIFRKPAKLLQREKKEVLKILDDQLPITETTGETADKAVSQVSHLKYIPPVIRALTLAEKRERLKMKEGIEGFKMHVSAYYQGLSYKENGQTSLVDQLNPMWVRLCFEERFVTLVKRIGCDETKANILLKNRKWIPVPVGDCSDRPITSNLQLDVKVHYQQGDRRTCLFRSLASAFHHLGQKHTGSVLASIAKKNENMSADEQYKAVTAAIRKHETVYTKLDYWKKEKVTRRYDFIGEPNENPKLLVLRGCDGGTQHAVSVVGRIIFDSNLLNAMPLCKESLDWCCNCDGGFSQVQAVLQFRK
jgi:hypothetical protein